jgi:hypothetical protein
MSWPYLEHQGTHSVTWSATSGGIATPSASAVVRLTTRSNSGLCLDDFVAGLRDLGYVDGKKISVEARFPTDSNDAQVSAVAEALVAERVDVIIACGTPASLAAQRSTSTIPIIALLSHPSGGCLLIPVRHLLGNVRWNSDTKGIRDRLIDVELVDGRLLNWQIGGLCPFQDLVDQTGWLK